MTWVFLIITDQENYPFKLKSSTSVHTAETYTIYLLSSSISTNCNIIISNSLCTLTANSSPYPRNEHIQHIQKLIFEINNHTFFMWVPSHIGIFRDKKAGFVDCCVYEVISYPLSIQINPTFENFNIIHQKIMDEW